MTLKPDLDTPVSPANRVSGPAQGSWTYKDYAALPNDGNNYELINGVLYLMPPSADFSHQSSNALFVTYLTIHVKFPGLGHVFGPPFDVVLDALGTVVQPDVMVVLNAHKDRIGTNRINGAPDLVIEIASPSTAKYDRTGKRVAYEQAGVAEYWIARPTQRDIEVLVLEQGVYRSIGVFSGADLPPSQVVPGLPVRVEQFFA